MAKTLAAGMTTHVAGDVTTLAVCWRITREDGIIHRFTDHDVELVFPGAHSLTVTISAGEKFIAIGAFSRTAIEAKAGLQVNNLDLSGLMNADAQTGGIKLSDLRVGKFTNAQVEVFLVNWADLTDGVIPILRGNLGEVKLNIDSKTYEAEVRGLSQKFAQKIADIYTPKCRVDLFSTKCGLTAATFTQRAFVESVVSNREFVVPAFQTLPADPAGGTSADPARTTGIRQAAVVEPTASLRLRKGPREIGTRDAPILVATTTQLTNIRNNPFAHYALTTDIDMSAFGFFTPIPTFRGSIDGRGHAIIGLDVDRIAGAAGVGDAGLIAILDQGAVIRRLGFIGGVSRVGGSANFCAMLAATRGADIAGNFGGVEDCYVIGAEIITDSDRAAGLVGFARDQKFIRRCVASVRFSGSIGTRVGNVLGEATGAGTTIENNFGDSDAGVSQDGLGVPASSETRLTTAQLAVTTNTTILGYVDAWLRPEDQTAVTYDNAGNLTFADANPDTITRSSGSFVTDGFTPGMRVVIAGSASNNGTFNVAAVSATVLTLVGVDALVAEGPVSGAGITIVEQPMPALKVKEM